MGTQCAQIGSGTSRPRNAPPPAETFLREDAPDLAAVDVELASDGALAVTGGVPGTYRLLQAWCFRPLITLRHHAVTRSRLTSKSQLTPVAERRPLEYAVSRILAGTGTGIFSWWRQLGEHGRRRASLHRLLRRDFQHGARDVGPLSA
jgi:hypothetical protein